MSGPRISAAAVSIIDHKQQHKMNLTVGATAPAVGFNNIYLRKG